MFRIGEFSIIAQVSGRRLRYYDEIGLLSPDYTDPQTGYRFYSAEQLPRLNRILVLKELGLSLDQIARLLSFHTSNEEIRGMLTLRKAQIAQSVQEELTRLQMVETRLEQIAAHGQMQEPDVVLKSIPAQRYLALREVLPDIAAGRRLVSRIATVLPTAVSPGSLVIESPMSQPGTSSSQRVTLRAARRSSSLSASWGTPDVAADGEENKTTLLPNLYSPTPLRPIVREVRPQAPWLTSCLIYGNMREFFGCREKVKSTSGSGYAV